jgi:hypothetical protein
MSANVDEMKTRTDRFSKAEVVTRASTGVVSWRLNSRLSQSIAGKSSAK